MVNTSVEASSVTRIRASSQLNKENRGTGKVADNHKILNKYRTSNVNMARKDELISPISQFPGVFVITGIPVYGSGMILSGNSDLEASDFITYLHYYFHTGIEPAKEIFWAVSSIQQGRIVQRATHAELNNMAGLYQKLSSIQSV